MPKKSKENKTSNPVRQPIVAVMGHVDHGKTSFLDRVRGTRVADKEFGGITQNTRVHEVTTKTGFKITFIDTPGHEAFSKMRERGARVTDFVFLVVAANDGVQPQTKESIEFAHSHNVPIIVGINKIDALGADVLKIKTQLSSFGVQVEEFGGDVLAFPISAKTGEGIDDALEGIQLLTEINELKSNEPKEGVIAEAFVLESKLQKSIGYAATAILKTGNLKDRLWGVSADDIFKVRAYLNEEGKPVTEVKEAQPFTVIGLNRDLTTGDIINFVNDEKSARELQTKLKTGEISEDTASSSEGNDAESLFAQLLMNREEKKGGVEQKTLNVVLRSSTQGTLEAILEQLKELETEESRVNVLQSGTGVVTEDDIMKAKVAHGIILTFQTPTPSKELAIARREKVLIRDYEIIYELIDEVAEVLDSLDTPREEEIEIARAKVKQVFTLSDGSQVAGSEVTKGTFIKGYKVYAVRGEQELENSRVKVKQVKQQKNEVREVKKGQECGLLLDPAIEGLQEGDEIVAFRMERL